MLRFTILQYYRAIIKSHSCNQVKSFLFCQVTLTDRSRLTKHATNNKRSCRPGAPAGPCGPICPGWPGGPEGPGAPASPVKYHRTLPLTPTALQECN